MTDADDSAFPVDDKHPEHAAASRRLDEALPALAAIVGAGPEQQAVLREELEIAARSYWNLRQLPRPRLDFHPSVAKRKLAGLRRSIGKVTKSLRGFPDPYFRFAEALVGSELLARHLTDADAIRAALEGIEDVIDFAVPSSTDRCVDLLFSHLAKIFTAATGMRPTHTWNDPEGNFTSPFDRFAREAAAAIDPEIKNHGSVAEAIRRIWAKHNHKPDDPRYRALFEALDRAAQRRAGGHVARRAKPPS
jgi:hypothetical protein